MERIVAKFEGEIAEAHRLPAYEAAVSSYGISRSLLMTLNYLAEGRVRRRNFSSRAFQFHIVAQREGSFESIYEVVTNPTLMAVTASLGAGVAGNFLTDFIRSIFNRCIGEKAVASIEQLELEDQLNTGDLGALVEAIEPAVRAAHTVVNHGAGNIVLISGDNNIVKFDAQTKRYIWSSIRDETIRSKLMSIASFNANAGSGRAYDFELGRTIPFQLEKHVDRDTLASILHSMSNYAYRRLGDNLGSAIAVQFEAIVAVDGRVKKITIHKARREMTEL